MVEELIPKVEKSGNEALTVTLEERIGLLNAVQGFIEENPRVSKILQFHISEIIWRFNGELHAKGDMRKKYKPIIEELFSTIRGSDGES
jgi:hypothetical protein